MQCCAQPISVNAILKPGKWSKRYLVVNDASSTVELYKSKQGQGEHTTLCSLSTFDSHLANSAHFASLKPPKTFLLVLKSIQPFAFFERKEDAMHVLSFGSAEQRDAAFALLRECRVSFQSLSYQYQHLKADRSACRLSTCKQLKLKQQLYLHRVLSKRAHRCCLSTLAR